MMWWLRGPGWRQLVAQGALCVACSVPVCSSRLVAWNGWLVWVVEVAGCCQLTALLLRLDYLSAGYVRTWVHLLLNCE